MGAQHFNFASKLLQNGGFQPQILHFLDEKFLGEEENFQTIFQQTKI